MSTARPIINERLRTNSRQFLMFGIVGGSGVLVNMLVAALCLKFSMWTGGPGYADAIWNLAGTRFNIRGFHVFTTVAFLVANVWNYQLNRKWTFGKVQQGSWIRGFIPFLLTGLMAFVVQFILLNAMLNPTSPLHLPAFLDDSSGLRNKYYWANAISIVIAMPVNFIVNKLWAFRAKKPTRVVLESEPTPAD